MMFSPFQYAILLYKFLIMKLRIIIIALVLLVNNCFAQTSGEISPSQIASWISKPASFTSVSEAKTMIADIIEVIGLKQNFEVMAANVDNAAAVVYQGKRYILYNPDFINRLNAAAGNKWASVSILAHEIGHHLNGHTLENIGSQPEKELEADEFSGFVLRRMGATLAEAQAAMKIAANYKRSLTHPGQAERLTAIAGGWNRANIQQGGKDLAKTTPVLKQTNNDVYINTQQRTQPIRQNDNTRQAPGGESNEPRVNTNRVNRDDGGYVTTNTGRHENSLVNDRYIVADITFAAEQQSSFYLTTQFNIVRQMNNRLYSIGKMVATDNTAYPFIITDEAGTKLWIDSRGNIINGNSRSVGFLKVRK
ncbi:MAG: hypothetical protein JWO92_1737 [Chitinophagaceae bacterium]|nr:hypothetical protein [Chitinophagaceae bacterium]